MPLFLFVFVHSIDNTKDRKAFAGRLYIFNALMAFLDLAYNIMPIPSERYYGIFVRLDTNIFGTFFALYVLILVIKKTIARSAHWKKILAAYIFWQAATVGFCTFVSIQLNDAYCLFFAAISGNSVGNCPIFFQKPKMEMCILVFRSGIGKFRYYLKPNHPENLHASFI